MSTPPKNRKPTEAELWAVREITALNEEARRRGTSYGKFVSGTTADEREEIVRKYIKSKERKAKRKAR